MSIGMKGIKAPVAAIVLAIVCGVVLLLSGSSVGPVLAMVVVWILSFWLVEPAPPERRKDTTEGVQLTRSGMRDLIEHSGLPMLMLDHNRIIVANANAREAIGGHILGQDARVALRHPVAVDLLSRPGGGSVTPCAAISAR